MPPVRSVELYGAVSLQKDELRIIIRQYFEIHALAVQSTLKLERELGEIKHADLKVEIIHGER